MPTAFVLMKCDDGTEERVLQYLEDYDCEAEFQPTIGEYDLVAKFTTDNMDDLNQVIDQVKRDNDVHRAKILLGISEAADSF